MSKAKSTQRKPARIGTVLPYVWVSELTPARHYYVEKLGFEEAHVEEWDDEGKTVGISVMERDGTAVQLGICQCPGARHLGQTFFGVEVKGIEVLYEEYVSESVPMFVELVEREWGAKEFIVEDPDGNRIHFFESV